MNEQFSSDFVSRNEAELQNSENRKRAGCIECRVDSKNNKRDEK